MPAFITCLASFLTVTVLYGLQWIAKRLGVSGELVNAKNPPPPGTVGNKPKSIAGRLHARTKRRFEQLSDPGAVLFLASDEIQSKLVAWISRSSPATRRVRQKAPHHARQQIALAYAGLGPQRRLAIQQAKNTRYIFVLVRNNPEFLGIPKTGEFDLAVMLERAYGIGEFENIWSVEGLGHVYSQRTWALEWNAGEDAHGIMTDGQAAALPDKSLTMMHAGLGLGFAESLMKQLTPVSTAAEIERVLTSFIRLCYNNSRAGYVGCALESLGLVTRCFNYSMVQPVQRVLAELDPVAWEYFWRGVGRGIYFSPAHLLQPLYSPWIAADQEAPDDRVHNILKSGLSWPANIVNMRTPETFMAFLQRYGAAEENQAAIAQGVAASTTMAVDITPGHSVVKAYLDYVPETSDQDLQRLWQLLAHDPVARAVHRYQPVLKRHAMMDQVFRFQDLDALVDRLEPPVPASRSQPMEV